MDLSFEQIETYCKSFVREIANDPTGWKPDMVVGIARGGLLPAVMMSHLLEVPLEAVSVQLRDAYKLDVEKLKSLADCEDVKILVVEDINDSGSTLQHISKYLGHSDTRYAVLVNNVISTFQWVHYKGTEIDRAIYKDWITFPWESK